ncbi:bifunctional UDP-N-acetylglucosamine diphosphorylase/glucosamine-1-phosphate N-acetyltransferase GlmU [bacterium]|nr:MAG: bifunctional UDP-N-acetylglucosamine diphosphorylase/glucosamine-1-phosphate N-acetyltransferase GlmU [bacterium]
MPTNAAIVLAAGKGTRMKSDLPKVLHPVCGLPMVAHVVRALRGAGVERIVVVVGHGGEKVQEALGDSVEYAWQREQLGTGHAVRCAVDALQGHEGPVVIASGDTPLVTQETMAELLQTHGDRALTVATAILDDPTGYGRIVRDATGKPTRIVEQKDASPEQRSIREVNAGLYAFDAQVLFALLPRLRNANAQNEYYLTDLVQMASGDGLAVDAHTADAALLQGVNDRWQLAEAEAELRKAILKRHAMAGVTLRDPSTTYIEADVQIEPDAVIEPGCHLLGSTTIGAGARIGPNSLLRNATIAEGAKVQLSVVEESTVGAGAKVGPYAHLRGRSRVGAECRIGNFVELKNAEIGERAAAAHLTYLGDATIGARSNIGAGTITCNYDGFKKSRTTVGADVFVGSQSTLIAPIQIGDGAMLAAGSTITNDVPAGAGAFGRARQETKEEWATKWREKRKVQG